MWNSWSDLARSISSGEGVPRKLDSILPYCIACAGAASAPSLDQAKSRSLGVHEADMFFFMYLLVRTQAKGAVSVFSPGFAYRYLLPYEFRRVSLPYFFLSIYSFKPNARPFACFFYRMYFSLVCAQDLAATSIVHEVG